MDILRPTNLNGLSIYWTVLFAVGIVVGYLNTRAVLKERRSVIGVSENGRTPLMRLHAQADALTGILRELGQTAGFVIGLASFYIPAAKTVPVQGPLETRRIFYSFAVVLVLFLIEHCQIGILLVEFWRRWQADQLAEKYLRSHSLS